MKIKIPVKDLERRDDNEKVIDKLQGDPDNAYTVMGLMVEVFGVKESQIKNKPFSDWEKGLPRIYTSIRRCLDKEQQKGSVKKIKQGTAWYYWWTGERTGKTKFRLKGDYS